MIDAFLLTGEIRIPQGGEHYIIEDHGELGLAYKFRDDKKVSNECYPIAKRCTVNEMLSRLLPQTTQDSTPPVYDVTRIAALETQLAARDAELAAANEAVRVLALAVLPIKTIVDGDDFCLTVQEVRRVQDALNNPLARASVEKASKV